MVNEADSFDQLVPAITLAEDGTIYVVWMDGRNDYGDIYFSASYNAGQTFGPDVRVSDDLTSAVQIHPSIAVGKDGKIHVVWSDWRNDADGKLVLPGGGIDGKNNCDIYYANSTDGGETFNPNVKVNYDPDEWVQSQLRGSVAVDSENGIHVVWWGSVDGGYSNNEIFYANSEDGGISFNPSKIISSSNKSARYPSISVDDSDNIYVVWHDQRNRTSAWDIYLNKSTNKGHTFVGARKVNGDNLANASQIYPSISSSEGLVAVTWQDFREDGLDIYFALSNDGGESFQDDVKVNDDTLSKPQYQPSVAIDKEGQISVVWEDRRNNDYDTYFANSYDFGSSFSANQRVNDDTGKEYQYYPDIVADDNGYVYIVWQDHRNGNWDIYFSRAPQNISDLMITDTDVSFTPSSPVPYGSTVGIDAVIHNIGSRDARNVTVRFYDGLPTSGSVIGEDQISLILKEGGIGLSHIDWIAVPPETHEICVVADPENNITESNESNNMACKPIEVIVPSLPDLTLSPLDISFDQPPPFANGTSININATVHNIGYDNATNVSVRFMDNPYGQIEGDKNMSLIPIGGERFAEAIWNTTPTGSHEICVIADPEKEIAELDETNNQACILVEVADMSIPSPPTNLNAFLSGNKFENVTLSWNLSLDDGSSKNNVARYDIYKGSVYDSSGSSYLLHESVLSGTTSYVDIQAGEGNPGNYFYYVCALNAFDLSSCTVNQAAKFTRPLSKGPSLVSIPLIQTNESIETVLQTVKYDRAWYYDSSSQEWKWYMTSKGYRRGLWNINHTIGIWVNVTENSNLTMAGVVPAQTAIHLYEGWNPVSFPSFNSSYTVYDLRMDTGAVRVEGYDSSPPYHLRVLGDAEVLLAGEAYWVKVEADITWTVDIV